MKKQQPILDEDYPLEKSTPEKSTSNIKTRTVLYTLVMLIGGMIYYYYNAPEFRDTPVMLFLGALVFISLCLIISLVLESYRLFRRKRKTPNPSHVQDPFWFQVYEGSFSIWFLFTILFIIGQILKWAT